MRKDKRALVVDDEADIRELLQLTLVRLGLDVETAASIQEARARLEAGAFDLCLTDMRLSDGEGLALVRHINQQYPQLPVAVITAHGHLENAVASFKEGAFDYLAKPVQLAQLRALVKTALDLPGSRAEDMPGRLIGESAAIVQVRDTIERLGRTQAPVHITGESGCGKELAARLIHARSTRRDAPFIAVNCGALPEHLVEAEFFGYVKGAFTGADRDRDGFFQAADGGTLFLDEVADLPLPLQVKLLRAIQEKRVRRVGSAHEEAVDVRILSATHQRLAECVEERRFRQDLFYRLNVIELRMPSLREMPEDIPQIAAAWLERHAARGGAAARLTEAAAAALSGYDFPGNVRELENILERAVALSGSETLRTEDLGITPTAPRAPDAAPDGPPGEGGPLQERLDRVEREALLAALEASRWNRTAAAAMLGITFRSLRYRLKRLGIE